MYIQRVANEFVREYYTRLCTSPSTLYELYAADASLSHGQEGESQNGHVVSGEEKIKEFWSREDLRDSKVRVTDVSFAPSIASSISVLVMGDIKLESAPAKMFVQTFILHHNDQRGPLIVSDLRKYPQQTESAPVAAASPAPAATKVPQQVNGNVKNSVENDEAEVEKEKRKEPTSQASTAAFSGTELSELAPSATPAAVSTAASTSGSPAPDTKSEDKEKAKKGKKFKFSFDTIAKAPSFHPTSRSPNFGTVNFPVNSYSPTYPAAPTFQGMQIPYQMSPMFQPAGYMSPMQPQPQPYREGYRENYRRH